MFSHACKRAAVAAVSVLGFAPGAWAGPVVVSQAWNNTSAIYGSQEDPNPAQTSFLTAYDDFTLGSAQQIDTVQWIGGFYNPNVAVPIDSFTIQFYTDAGGLPGASVYSARQAATSTSLGTRPSLSFGDIPMFSYAMDLDVDFLADPGTRYWISIVANLPFIGFTQQWGLASSAEGNGAAVQNSNGAVLRRQTDYAFTLTAAGPLAVPEPGSLSLVALAVAGLLLRSHRPSRR